MFHQYSIGFTIYAHQSKITVKTNIISIEPITTENHQVSVELSLPCNLKLNIHISYRDLRIANCCLKRGNVVFTQFGRGTNYHTFFNKLNILLRSKFIFNYLFVFGCRHVASICWSSPFLLPIKTTSLWDFIRSVKFVVFPYDFPSPFL